MNKRHYQDRSPFVDTLLRVGPARSECRAQLKGSIRMRHAEKSATLVVLTGSSTTIVGMIDDELQFNGA